MREQPDYVTQAMRGLTKVQKAAIIAGHFRDESMATVLALKRRHLFYHKIDSPNGRCGPMVLTPLGVTVQTLLKPAPTPQPEARPSTGTQEGGEL